MKIFIKVLGCALLSSIAIAGIGCNSWDTASSKTKGTVGGAAVGGVAGAVIDDKSGRGALVGAAAGGLVGRQIGKEKDRNRELEDRVNQLENQ